MNGFSQAALLDCLAEPAWSPDEPAHGLTVLCTAGLDRLPAPGGGQTLDRWRALATVAAHDLSLCKLYEGHTDALAIIAEVGGDVPPVGTTWGMWAAEPPHARVRLNARTSRQDVRLDGLKAWCSGAAGLTHALLTCWDEEGQQQLVAVSLEQPGVIITDKGWHAVGMAATGSVEVRFEQALGHCIGDSGAYLARPGFWQGGGGIAACWFGAAQAIGEALRGHCRQREEVHALAHLGAVDASLHAMRINLQRTAAWIDAHPQQNGELPVRRLREQSERCASTVIEHCGRALGAAPFCRDSQLARLLTDLPVYLRQSHAERDLEVLGRGAALEDQGTWMP